MSNPEKEDLEASEAANIDLLERPDRGATSCRHFFVRGALAPANQRHQHRPQ
jgi:hypothetical protein